MEGALLKLIEAQKKIPAAVNSDGGSNDEGVLINGINVMCIPSRDAYSCALQLMDLLFMKEEMVGSLLFKSDSHSATRLVFIRANLDLSSLLYY